VNKAQLIDSVASKADVSKADAGRAVDATLSAIGASLSAGDNVSLVGFGTFSVRHRAARMGRNPQTGAAIHINASKSDMSKADAGRAVDATLSAIGGSLSGGDSVSLVGFGTFSVRHRAARMGRNPQTGATIQIGASKSVGFKAGKALKESL